MSVVLGKKLYQSRAMPIIKLVAVLIAVILLLNLYFQTYSDPIFIKTGQEGIGAVFKFHFKYPQEFFVYLLAVLFPAIYYGFIRGVRFFENALVINRGLPFFNMAIAYEKIAKYEIISQKHLLAIRRKDTEDDYMFTVNRVDRVVAILDQHSIPGELGTEARIDKSARRKLAVIFIGVGILMALIQYSGFVRQFLR